MSFGRTNLKDGFDAPGAIETNANEEVSAADVVIQLDNIADSTVNRLDDPYGKFGGTTGGSSTAYTLTINDDYSGTAYNSGQFILMKVHVDSGTNPTLNINSIGALPIYDDQQNRISSARQLKANEYYLCIFDTDADGSGTDGIVIITGLGGADTPITGVSIVSASSVTIAGEGTYVFDGDSTSTWTLPAGSSSTENRKYYFANKGTANVSIEGAGSDTIDGSDPFIMYPGTRYVAIWDSETWLLF
jgi:hypothetical protein